MFKLFLLTFIAPLLFAQTPSSTNFKLHDYGIGSGGTSSSGSSNYQLEGITGETSGGDSSSSTYKTKSGFISTQQANVPAAPTFTNPSNYYNKLHFVINPSGNPSDTIFAIAISTDNFATTNYIQNDDTIGPTLGSEDYQTYASWGSSTGQDVIGLTPSTTYQIKVKAYAGKFTESAYGPSASASTVGPTLSFSITTDSQSSPPFSIDFGNLLPGTVTTSSDKINVSFATNAQNGGNVYIYDSNNGIKSTDKSYTIASATTDLASANEGYGAISVSAGQSSGGPLGAQSPYDGTSDNVGILSTSIRPIYATANSIVGGSGSFRLKAKSSTLTPSASDYTDIITLIAAGQF